MAVSKVDVANKALLEHIGADPIVSFSDNVTESNAVSNLWETVRDEVLREHPWRCLKKRASLAYETSATPNFGWTYAYPFPNDCLRIIGVYQNSIEIHDQWAIEGRYILSDDTGPIQVVYIKDSDNPSEWDSLLVGCVAARLAQALAPTLAPDKLQEINAKYQMVHAEAKRVNSQEGEQPRKAMDSWVSVRF